MNDAELKVRFVLYDELADQAVLVFPSAVAAQCWKVGQTESVRVEVWGHPGSFRVVGWYADMNCTPMLATNEGDVYGGLPALSLAYGRQRYGGFA
ncbi:hypothetical protein [Achromobacter ruhlandii]|uniref:hypothetical protein n=1 Tax=Achromobacter ruhlandii TaxID=72557 RepID=UPI003BA24FE7